MAATLATAPIAKDDLLEFLQNQDDFALELFIYRNALEAGLQATHGGSYSDRVTGLSRQFDVRAGVALSDKIRVELAIECKCLKPYFPLLISRIPRSKEESFNELIIRPHTQDEPHSMDGLKRGYPQISRLTEIDSAYLISTHVGKSTAQVGRRKGNGSEQGLLTSNDSEVYEKWGQALASANDLVQDALSKAPYTGKEQESVMVIPILVVSDGALWVADYNETGNLIGEPMQMNSVEMFVGEKYFINWYGARIGYVISHMHIFTKNGIVEFIKTLTDGRFLSQMNVR